MPMYNLVLVPMFDLALVPILDLVLMPMLDLVLVWSELWPSAVHYSMSPGAWLGHSVSALAIFVSWPAGQAAVRRCVSCHPDSQKQTVTAQLLFARPGSVPGPANHNTHLAGLTPRPSGTLATRPRRHATLATRTHQQ